MTTISLRLDDDMKKELDIMCDEMGMNITTFFMIYAKRALRDRRIPFAVEAAPVAPTSVNAEMMTASEIRQKMQHSYKQIEEGGYMLAAEALEKYK